MIHKNSIVVLDGIDDYTAVMLFAADKELGAPRLYAYPILERTFT